MSTDPSPILSYAPPPPPPKRLLRRRHVVWIVTLFSLAVIAAYSWRHVVRLYATSQAYVWQQRCLAHQLPPDTIVYSDDPATAAKLLADPRYFRATPDGPAVYDPVPLRQMQQWRQYEGSVSHGRGPYGGLFLHARRPAGGGGAGGGGGERLVAVAVLPFGGELTAAHVVTFYGTTVRPGTLTRFWEVDGAQQEAFHLMMSGSDRLTVFAGQPDPSDPSHFTIPYTWNGTGGTIDGWLRAGGKIDLRPREGVARRHVSLDFEVWDLPAAHAATAPGASTAPVHP